MGVYKVKLKNRREIAAGTMAFYLEKPEGFVFKPGQSADFKLIDPPETDDEGIERTFSFANAPYEDDLMVATRMRDTAFKRVLKTMSLGTEIIMDAPHGSLTLQKDSSAPAVYLTGGIGVTPARSIVLQAAHDKLSHKIILFDSNTTPENTAFLSDLIEAEKHNPNFKLVATMTNMEDSSSTWSGERGFINKEMIARYVADLGQPIYYISGPPGMVGAMEKLLVEAGADEDKIRSEEFAGY